METRSRQKEREALLLSRWTVTDLYHNDDAALKRIMSRAEIEEEQDVISRLIRSADRMSDEQLKAHVRIL